MLWTGAAGAAEPWHGRWIIDPNFCKDFGDTTDTMPLIVRPTSLQWFTARCTYRSAGTRGDRSHLDARCSGEGERSRIPIVLQLKGERLVVRWGSTKPNEMHRCP